MMYGPDARARWAPRDDATLRTMWAAGSSVNAIAERLGKTADAVKHRRRLLRLPLRHVGDRSASWPAEDVEQLVQLHALGLGPSRIVARMGHRYTRNAIIGRLNRMGLRTPDGIAADAKRAALKALHDANRAKRKAAQKAKNNNPSSKPPRNGACDSAPLERSRPAMKPVCVKDGRKETPALPAMQPCVAAVSIMDVRLGQCRYVGERPAIIDADTPVFCGAPTAPRADGTPTSWCAAHLARVTARVQAREA